MLPGLTSAIAAGVKTFTIGNNGNFNDSGVTTVSGSSQNIGAEAADRYVILFIAANDSATNFTLNSATVNGVSAVVAADRGGVDAVSGSFSRSASIAIAHVPSGTSVTIAATFSESIGGNVEVNWLVVYGLTSTTAVDSANDGSSSSPSSLSVTIDVKGDGLTVAHFCHNDETRTADWNVGTELFDKSYASNSNRLGTMYYRPVSDASNATITATFSGSVNQASIAAATFV